MLNDYYSIEEARVFVEARARMNDPAATFSRRNLFHEARRGKLPLCFFVQSAPMVLCDLLGRPVSDRDDLPGHPPFLNTFCGYLRLEWEMLGPDIRFPFPAVHYSVFEIEYVDSAGMVDAAEIWNTRWDERNWHWRVCSAGRLSLDALMIERIHLDEDQVVVPASAVHSFSSERVTPVEDTAQEVTTAGSRKPNSDDELLTRFLALGGAVEGNALAGRRGARAELQREVAIPRNTLKDALLRAADSRRKASVSVFRRMVEHTSKTAQKL